MEAFSAFWNQAVGLVWGLPLVVMLGSAGLYFTVISRLVPLRHMGHAFAILSGRYDRARDPGEISHFRALSAALSGTIGMGNIAGVAIAITMGGSGAVFWMWVAGALGMATKFFTCTLSCMYRKPDALGVMQGGPMYYIEVGLGRRYRPLALAFAAFGMVGCLGVFQSNQLANLLAAQWSITHLATGLLAMLIVGVVVIGGAVRVGRVAGLLVPMMCVAYLLGAVIVILDHASQVPAVLTAIVAGAFDADSALGGAAGLTVKEILVTGVKRAVFSNEAGVGTEAMAHGAARTNEPVREGLIAMLGPFIDTHVICTLTALVILTSGVAPHEAGVVMTAQAFESSMPGFGAAVLGVIFTLFAVTTMITYAYYSIKCARYLFGHERGAHFVYFYLVLIPLAAVWNPATTVNMVDTAFALMVIPNLIATVLLAPRVLSASVEYFSRVDRDA
ncbi:MAG: amino acid carrier protein [Pseudomonadota bacterium]|nr:amino acid carrier protein [Pseudomonadota bacterium]